MIPMASGNELHIVFEKQTALSAAGTDTYTTGVGVTSLLVRAWGGGGGVGAGGTSCPRSRSHSGA